MDNFFEHPAVSKDLNVSSLSSGCERHPLVFPNSENYRGDPGVISKIATVEVEIFIGGGSLLGEHKGGETFA